jgi:hypothetical protein
MLTEIRIYYEGDGLLREGLSAFFSDIRTRAKEKGCNVRFIPANGTPQRDFGIAIKTNTTSWNILLLDSEGPDDGRLSASLCAKMGWDPSQIDSIFWMVEMMESWFHADKEALQSFYGSGFNRKALKANPEVEKIPKKDLKAGLKAATKGSSKGDYYDHKTSHGKELLGMIVPARVREAGPNCRRMFDVILAQLA